MTKNLLKEFANERNLTQSDIAKDLGVTRQSVSRWMSGQLPEGKNLATLAAYMKISEAYLKYGIKDGDGNVKAFCNEDKAPDDVVPVYEYNLAFAAGDGCIPEWEVDKSADPYWFKLSFFQKRHARPEKCKMAKVRGDSMEPYLYNGDSILFVEFADSRAGVNPISDGSVYVLAVDGKLKVKRLSTTKNGITLRSDNPDYLPETFTAEETERLRIFGKVIHISRSCD